ncbi:MAG: DnaJ domain-containing protein [Bacteroidales bacterium]
MEYKDYYKILGVDKKASQDDIKKAYRKLALKYHPDKLIITGQEKFKDINETYEVIGSQEKRKKRMTSLGPTGNNTSKLVLTPSKQGFQVIVQEAGIIINFMAIPPEMFGNSGFSDFFESFSGRSGSGFGDLVTITRNLKVTTSQGEISITLGRPILVQNASLTSVMKK